MLERFKTPYAKLLAAGRGERFLNYYRYCQKQRGEDRGNGMIGVTAELCMVVMGWIFSGVPGFLFSLPGLGLVAGRSRAVAVFLDR